MMTVTWTQQRQPGSTPIFFCLNPLHSDEGSQNSVKIGYSPPPPRCLPLLSPASTAAPKHSPSRLPLLRRQLPSLAADSSYPVPKFLPLTFVAVVAVMARGMAVVRAAVAVAVSVVVALAMAAGVALSVGVAVAVAVSTMLMVIVAVAVAVAVTMAVVRAVVRAMKRVMVRA